MAISHKKFLILATLLFIPLTSHAANIYKCTDSKGKITYQNKPCGGGKGKVMEHLTTSSSKGSIFYAAGDSEKSDILLHLKSWQCVIKTSYTYLQGEVQNISDKKLSKVMAVGDFRASNGVLVESEDALLDYSTLLPGQSSPFKVMQKNNPAINNCTVKFRFLGGKGISYRQ
jgi:hypothetical protein